MYGRGSIILETHPQALTVPISAVQITRRKKYVFIVKGNRVFQRAIETGVDGEEWLEVTRGLSPGEEVVTAGAEGLGDSSLVRVTRGIDPFSGQKVGNKVQAAAQP